MKRLLGAVVLLVLLLIVAGAAFEAIAAAGDALAMPEPPRQDQTVPSLGSQSATTTLRWVEHDVLELVVPYRA